MAKYYKSLAEGEIRVDLYGIGEVVVPKGAKCVELPAGAAVAINGLVFPDVLLEEVSPTITIEDEDDFPVAKATKGKKHKKVEEVVEEVSEEEELNTELDVTSIE